MKRIALIKKTVKYFLLTKRYKQRGLGQKNKFSETSSTASRVTFKHLSCLPQHRLLPTIVVCAMLSKQPQPTPNKMEEWEKCLYCTTAEAKQVTMD